MTDELATGYQRLVEFNDRLTAIIATGLPVEVTPGRRGDLAMGDIEAIQVRVAQAVAAGDSVDESFLNARVPTRYVAAFRAWNSGASPEDSFGSLVDHRRENAYLLSQATLRHARLWLLWLLGLAALWIYHSHVGPRWRIFADEVGLSNTVSVLPSPLSWLGIVLLGLAVGLLVWPRISRGSVTDRPPSRWTGFRDWTLPWIVEGVVGGIVVAVAAYQFLGPYFRLLIELV